MKLLDDYFTIQKQIYDYFGYVDDWKVIPLDDSREYFWYENANEVYFAKTKDDFQTEKYYSNEIFTYRHLPKFVYRAEDFTMIVVDTNTDGNKFLQIFDNNKELTNNPIDE